MANGEDGHNVARLSVNGRSLQMSRAASALSAIRSGLMTARIGVGVLEAPPDRRRVMKSSRPTAPSRLSCRVSNVRFVNSLQQSDSDRIAGELVCRAAIAV